MLQTHNTDAILRIYMVSSILVILFVFLKRVSEASGLALVLFMAVCL